LFTLLVKLGLLVKLLEPYMILVKRGE